MKCVVLSTVLRAVVNSINSTNTKQQVEPIKLTDGRYVVDADMFYDADWGAWGNNASLKNLPQIEITGSLFWENKILTLCARDKRSIATPQLYEAAKAYYLSRGEL